MAQDEVLSLIYPDVRVRVLRVQADMREHHGKQMRACQGLRTWEEQAALYAKGRTTPGPKVTNAPPGESAHNFGLAVDCCFTGGDPWLDLDKDSKFLWEEYGKFTRAHGLVWGGDFKSICDRPHGELIYGMSFSDLRDLYGQGKVAAIWAKCDQIRGIPVASEWKTLENKLSAL